MTETYDVTVRDIAYRTAASEPLLARLYIPAGRGPFPAVVSVHGGRWVSQSRLTNEVIDRALAEAGTVVMAVDFRMPPVVRYPEPVADINFAIRWLKQVAKRLRSDPALVGGIGTSSGGHQLMLSALRPGDPRYTAFPLAGCDAGADLAYVIACWPVLDPLARYQMARRNNMDLHIQSHRAYWPDEAAMAEGNPQLILERGESKKLPPLLLIQGTADTTVPPEMTQRFFATYRACGGNATLELFEGKPHTFMTHEPDAPESRAARAAIVRFVLERAQHIRGRVPA
jgi:acetyl esterase/lipase